MADVEYGKAGVIYVAHGEATLRATRNREAIQSISTPTVAGGSADELT
jgi:hypothetical protein